MFCRVPRGRPHCPQALAGAGCALQGERPLGGGALAGPPRGAARSLARSALALEMRCMGRCHGSLEQPTRPIFPGGVIQDNKLPAMRSRIRDAVSNPKPPRGHMEPPHAAH